MKTSWKFYLSADEAWDGMYAACAAAKKSIDFEQYLLSDDEIGRRFINLFIEQAKKGVTVRVLCDTIGSTTFFMSPISDELQRAGVQVLFFNPITPWWLHHALSWFLRDHRKILIVDNAVGFTGGVGVEVPMKGWRDTHVEIRGHIVPLMQRAFEQMWVMTKKGERFIKFPWFPAPASEFNFLTNSPYRHQRFIYHMLIAAIRDSRKYVYLTTPYFVPNGRLFRALKQARARGVDVRLIMPRNSDHPFVDLASQSYFSALLRAGISLFLYSPGMIHAKSVVIDDVWASVGSANLDNLSLLLNYEDAIVSTDKKFIQELKDHFEVDQKHSELLDATAWKKRSTLKKFLQVLTMPLHRVL